MASSVFEGYSADLSFSESDFKSGADGRALLDFDEQRFVTGANLSQNDSLPSAFHHPLNSSDWSLRLSHVSLTPTSDQSATTRRQVTVDEYIARRTHKLGLLDGNDTERPTFDMSFSSPSSDRTPIVYYHCGNTSVDSKQSESHKRVFMNDSVHDLDDSWSAFEHTITPLESGCLSTSFLGLAPWNSRNGECVVENCTRSSLAIRQESSSVSGLIPWENSENSGNGVSRAGSLLIDACPGLVLVSENGEDGAVKQSNAIICSDQLPECTSSHTVIDTAVGIDILKEVNRCLGKRQRHKKIHSQSGSKPSDQPGISKRLKGKENARPFTSPTKPSARKLLVSDSESVDPMCLRDSVSSKHSVQHTKNTEYASENSWKSPVRLSAESNKAKNVGLTRNEIFSLYSQDKHAILDTYEAFTALSLASNDSFDLSVDKPSPGKYSCSDGGLNVDEVYKRSSSTPVKDPSLQEPIRFRCHDHRGSSDTETSMQKKSSSQGLDAFAVAGTYLNEQFSIAQASQRTLSPSDKAKVEVMDPVIPERLSGGSLSAGMQSDTSLILADTTYESTVHLSLPTHVSANTAELEQDTSYPAVGTQTSLLSAKYSPKKKSGRRAYTPCSLGDKRTRTQLTSADVTGEKMVYGSMSVIAPTELRIDNACCVGLSAHGTLLLHNPTAHWMRVQLSVTQIYIDGQPADHNISPFVVRPKVTVDPHSTESVKVIFAPRIAGVYVAQLSLCSGPVDDNVSLHGKLPVMVTLQAVSENPSVELVASDGSESWLCFTALPWGCETYDCVSIVNRGLSTIPVRLVISSSSRNCFMFDKRTTSVSRDVGDISTNKTVPKVILPTVYSCLLSGTDTDGTSHQRTVPVYFRAPRRSASRKSGCVEEIVGSIVAEVDVPTGCRLLASLDVMGTVGTAKLHVPRTKPVINYVIGRSSEFTFPLRNSGDIPLDVDIEFSDWSELFTVCPTRVQLDPGQQVVSCVTFRHRFECLAQQYESNMLLKVKPDGPVYEVLFTSQLIDGTEPTKSRATARTDAAAQTVSTTTVSMAPVKEPTENGSLKSTFDSGIRSESDSCHVLNSSDSCGQLTSTLLQRVGQTTLDQVMKCSSVTKTTNRERLICAKPTEFSTASLKPDIRTRHSELNDGATSRLLNTGPECMKPQCEDGWDVRPTSLILLTSSEKPDIRRVLVANNTDKEISFDLSWPAHVLTVCPGHGVVQPRGSMLVNVSCTVTVNQRIGSLPWFGAIQVMSCHQTKSVKVEIRDSFSSSVSESQHRFQLKKYDPAEMVRVTSRKSPADRITSCLPASVIAVHADTSSQCAVRFPKVQVGISAEMCVVFENVSDQELEWIVSPSTPAYIKADGSASCNHLSYSAFWWPRSHGFLQKTQTDEVRVCFCGREAGHYLQSWQVQFSCTNSNNTACLHSCRVDTFSIVVNAGLQSSVIHSSPSSIDSHSVISSSSHPVLHTSKPPTLRSADGLVSVMPKRLVFSKASVTETQCSKLKLKNRDHKTVLVKFGEVTSPFYLDHPSVVLRSRHFVCVPLQFRPQLAGQFSSQLHIHTDRSDVFTVELYGVCETAAGAS